MNGNSGNCKASGRIAATADFTKISSTSLPDWTLGKDLSVGYAPGSSTVQGFSEVGRQLGQSESGRVRPRHARRVDRGRPSRSQARRTQRDLRRARRSSISRSSTRTASDRLATSSRQSIGRSRIARRTTSASSTSASRPRRSGSFLSDPLCKAVRAATSLGMVVVVAAGNYGLTVDGREVLGAMGAPANEPTVITVGSAHPHDTVSRGDETLNKFSSRGPTRSELGRQARHAAFRQPAEARSDRAGQQGGRCAGRQRQDSERHRRGEPATRDRGLQRGHQWPADAAFRAHRSRRRPLPATVAVMLQANPGLTPGLVKAILQYTAQPLPQLWLVQQGTGLLNVDGAVRVAQSLRTDIADLKPGDSPPRHRQDAAEQPLDREWRAGNVERHHYGGRRTRRGGQGAPREVPRHLRHEPHVDWSPRDAHDPGVLGRYERPSTGVRPAVCGQDEGAVRGRKGPGRGRGSDQHPRLFPAGGSSRCRPLRTVARTQTATVLDPRFGPGRRIGPQRGPGAPRAWSSTKA